MGAISKVIKKMVNVSPAVKEAAVSCYSFFCGVRYQHYIRKYPINPQMVVFESYLGGKYGCSPRAMFEAMCKDSRYDGFLKVWMMKEPDQYQELTRMPNTIVVKYRSREYYQYYARAGVWVTNYLLSNGIVKRPGQIYVQTWHGTPLKKIGCDALHKEMPPKEQKRTLKKYQQEGQMIDFLPSPSAFYTEKIKSCFQLGTQAKILEEGYPRNDALFCSSEDKRRGIREKLGLPEGKKVILYAPTWRDDQHTAGTGYTYELGVDFQQLKQALAGEAVILFRAHYLISNGFDFESYQGFIRNVSEYDEINDLYLVSDLLITDYSSVFFDYANLKRPMLFYMYDYEKYKTRLRDFYFDISEIPGPVIKEKRDISKDIQQLLEHFVYDETYKKFNEKFNPVREACSSRILAQIFLGTEEENREDSV